MKKADQIRQLVRNCEFKESHEKDSVYKNKLAREVLQMRRFIAQADEALASILVDETDSKRRIIGLNEAYLKLGYIPDKDEVLGTAIADHFLESLTEKHEKQLKWLNNQPTNLTKLQEMLDDFKEIEACLDEGIEFNLKKLQDISNYEVDVNQSQVEELIKELNTISRDLKLSVKRVLTKFMACHTQELDQPTLKLALKSLSKMIDQLIKSRDWVEVIPDEFNVALIKTLIYNSIVTRRQDPIGSSSYFLKMTQFDE